MKKLILSVLTIIVIMVPLTAYAQVTHVMQGIPNNPEEGYQLCDLFQMLINVSDLIVALSGVFAIAMFIYGGVVLVTSYGNSERVEWGKNTLKATVVGIIIVFLAWTLVNTIIYSFYGNNEPFFGDWSTCSPQN